MECKGLRVASCIPGELLDLKPLFHDKEWEEARKITRRTKTFHGASEFKILYTALPGKPKFLFATREFLLSLLYKPD